jgi:hypothetical protein
MDVSKENKIILSSNKIKNEEIQDQKKLIKSKT